MYFCMYLNEFYNLVTDTTDKSVDKKKEIRAALTIAIFMRMLDKELWDNKKTLSLPNAPYVDSILIYFD